MKHTGGAIPRDVRSIEVSENIEPEAPLSIPDFLAHDEILIPRIPTVLHGIPRILEESPAPMFMLRPPAYSDEFLLKDLQNTISENSSIRNHHPEVRQVIFDSLSKHPSLLHHYMNA